MCKNKGYLSVILCGLFFLGQSAECGAKTDIVDEAVDSISAHVLSSLLHVFGKIE
jgi:hypothetical protein